ncbi:MAG: peptide chain release factor N(5)-glutamine methyltransferase [Patescibacteria group bacterium]
MRHLVIKSILQKSIQELTPFTNTPELDARVLLEAAIDKKTDYIFSHPEAPLTNADYAQFRRYIRRRKKGEPIAYILGHKEFYGLDFIVNKNVLIPRPETELLTEEALIFIKDSLKPKAKGRRQNNGGTKPPAFGLRPLAILDIGTGSGNIIIALASQQAGKSAGRQVKFHATDTSKKALYVAKKNAKRILFEHKREPGVNSSRLLASNNIIRFYHSDLFSNPRLPQKFGIVIANLPYVPQKAEGRRPKAEKNKGINFEPKEAIFADDKGTATVKRFLDQAHSRINADGLILVELDPRNALDLLKYARNVFKDSKIELKKDLAGRNRYLKILT